MRILIVSPYFPPQQAVAALRLWSMAQVFTENGQEVTVLTTAKRSDQRGMDLPREGFEVQEIEFTCPRILERLRASTRDPCADGAIDTQSTSTRSVIVSLLRRLQHRTGVYGSVRMPDLTGYWVKPAIDFARRAGTWDVAVSSSGPYTAHLVAMHLRRSGAIKRWVADFRDPWTLNHHYRGLFPFTIRERALERQCLREADMLCAATEGFAKSFRAMSGRDIEIIHNGYMTHSESSVDDSSIFPTDDLIRIVYTGTIYPRTQDPTPLLRAMADAKTADPHHAARLRLIAAGTGGDRWRELARAHGVDDLLETRGMITRSDALRMQRDADALFLVDLTDPTQGVLPVKAFEYLPMTAPILIVGGDKQSDLGRLVERAGRGRHCEGDLPAIGRFLANLVVGAPVHDLTRDDAFIKSLSREHQSLRLLELITQNFGHSV